MASRTMKKKSGVSVVAPGASRKERLGAILVARFEGNKVPATLAAPLKSLAKAQAELAAATSAVRAAQVERADAMLAVKGADAKLTKAIDGLANALVGAGMGTRQGAFASFSPLAPSKLARLAYARKVAAARAIAAEVRAKKLPAPVRAAVETLGASADAVAETLGGVTAPAFTLQTAQRHLAGAVATWSKAYARLKVFAAAAWVDEPATFRVMFAKPSRVEMPTRKKRKPSVRAAHHRDAEDEEVDHQADRDEREAHDR